MRKFLEHSNTILFLRVVLGIVFIYASIDKIADPISFSNAIDNYHITPKAINNMAALIVPFVEFVVGFCLIIGIFMDGAIFITIMLLIWFIFIISQALLRGIDLHCGCFDLSQKAINDGNLKLEMIKRIIEDFVFLIIAFIIKNRKNK